MHFGMNLGCGAAKSYSVLWSATFAQNQQLHARLITILFSEHKSKNRSSGESSIEKWPRSQPYRSHGVLVLPLLRRRRTQRSGWPGKDGTRLGCDQQTSQRGEFCEPGFFSTQILNPWVLCSSLDRYIVCVFLNMCQVVFFRIFNDIFFQNLNLKFLSSSDSFWRISKSRLFFSRFLATIGFLELSISWRGFF